ncbi:hypothetical protein DH2020_012727 [Rehmannia glutinosa]|uniref:Oleosin n=1 Tax=Rehmannia glutinosa TaxID=99300 RepID=A0ABR0X066_REHGL
MRVVVDNKFSQVEGSKTLRRPNSRHNHPPPRRRLAPRTRRNHARRNLIGLAVATPLFVICSPVLVPAAILLAGAVTGFLTSGAFRLTGLSSFSWVFNSFRKATGQEPLEYARRRVQEGIIQVGEKTKQVGEMVGEKTKQTGDTIKTKAQEGGGAGART